MADSTQQTLAAVTQAAKRAFTQERKRMLEKEHSSVCDAPPAHRQRGNDCSTISVPTKVVVQTMADGTTALVRVPSKAAHTAGGAGLSATKLVS